MKATEAVMSYCMLPLRGTGLPEILLWLGVMELFDNVNFSVTRLQVCSVASAKAATADCAPSHYYLMSYFLYEVYRAIIELLLFVSRVEISR
jgi:hypothetical protein